MSCMHLISPRAEWAGSQTLQQQVMIRCICTRVSPGRCPGPSRKLKRSVVAASHAHTVLKVQPRLSDLLTETTGPVGTIAWKAALDIALPILGLWLLLRLVNWAADQARVTIEARVASDSGIVDELKRRSTVGGLVLLALRTPAKFMLPPWLFAYTLRTALHIVDLVVNKYQPKLPQLAGYAIQQVSAQLVPLDAAMQQLLSISWVLFVTWFFVQLKDIVISEVILVRAIRSGNKELERVYLPLSSLVTWAAVLACALSICTSLGVSLQPLLAVGGAGGIAAGFASQQLLLNLVAGVNIFLTRPFIAGDQVVFDGGANIVGVVEGVQMTRTLLRTADGTLVAVPNKLVSDLIVYNRTRLLESGLNSAGGVAAAAPRRRVLCFTLQVDRGMEALLDDIRHDVRELLNSISREQLIQSGLTPEPASEGEAGSSQDEDSSSAPSLDSGRSNKDVGPAAAAAAVADAIASAVIGREHGKEKKTDAAAARADASDESNAAAALDASREGSPEPEPLTVSITLKHLTESHITLSVRCEMLLPASSLVDAVERQTEDILIATSGLVKEKYGAVLLW